MAARAASVGPFVAREVSFADAGVARDEISWLRADAEPLVLRVTVRGGDPTDMAMAGDWFCDADGSEPVLLPRPRRMAGHRYVSWHGEVTWIDAWESSDDPVWLLRSAASVGVARGLVVPAACACARTSLHLVPRSDTRAERAIEAAELWAAGRVHESSVRAASALATEASGEYTDAHHRLNADATVLSYDGTMSAAAHASEAATAASAAAFEDLANLAAMAVNEAVTARGGDGGQVLRYMAVLVRRKIPIADVLRAVAARTR